MLNYCDSYCAICFNLLLYMYVCVDFTKYGKCSKITNTKNNYFSAVRNFRNYVFGKMPVFEILECGLYQEKNGIYACQNVVETC